MSQTEEKNWIESSQLWEGKDIPIIGGTGEKGTGKTLFGLSIDPYDPTGEFQSVGDTLVFDFEGSSVTNKHLIKPENYFDCAKHLTRLHGKGYTALDRFVWFRKALMERITQGGVSVVMIDPVSELEEGLSVWVEKNPRSVGYTTKQFSKGLGLLMGAIKSYQKRFLDDIRTYIGTLYFTAHQRLQFKGGAPTGKREAKGKETLFELASLYLKFDRTPYRDKKTGEQIVPQAPFATVMKTRLNHTRIVEGVLQPIPILPPRIPNCTPHKIRQYILKPADFSHLDEAEQLVEEHLSEDDKLLLEANMIESRRAAAEAELANTLERKEMQERKAAANRQPIARDQTHAMEADTTAPDEPASADQKSTIKEMRTYFGDEVFNSVAKEMGVSPKSTYSQYAALIDRLIEMKIEKQKSELEEKRKELDSVPSGDGYVAVQAVVDYLGTLSDQRKAAVSAWLDAQGAEPASVTQEQFDFVKHRMSQFEQVAGLAKQVGFKMSEMAAWFKEVHSVDSYMDAEDSAIEELIRGMQDAKEKGEKFEPVPF